MYKAERKVFRRLLQELPDISKQTESHGSKRTNGDFIPFYAYASKTNYTDCN